MAKKVKNEAVAEVEQVPPPPAAAAKPVHDLDSLVRYRDDNLEALRKIQRCKAALESATTEQKSAKAAYDEALQELVDNVREGPQLRLAFKEKPAGEATPLEKVKGLRPNVVKLLAEGGVKTIADVLRLHANGSQLTEIKRIGATAAQHIRETLLAFDPKLKLTTA